MQPVKVPLTVADALTAPCPSLRDLNQPPGVCVAERSLQSSYPAFVMYTSLIYKNITTPVYTSLKGVSASGALRGSLGQVLEVFARLYAFDRKPPC